MGSDLRCSAWAAAHEVDPIGTAGSYRGYLLVEWPQPWPRDVSEIEALGELGSSAKEVGYRIQLLVPAPERGEARVIHYRWSDQEGRYQGHEAPADGDPVSVASAFLAGGCPAGTSSVNSIDLLICCHGRRDRCCGSAGTTLAANLDGPNTLPPGVRLWRTSHTGGHRFAPTAIILPEGTCWGYLDTQVVGAVLARSDNPVAVLPHYRGCTGLTRPAGQAIERAVLEEVGWDLLRRRRWDQDTDGGKTHLVVEDLAGHRRVWEGFVRVNRSLAVPLCGEPVSAGTKTEDELIVEGLRELQADLTGWA